MAEPGPYDCLAEALTPVRVFAYAGVFALTFLLVWVSMVVQADGIRTNDDGDVLGGDFPTFYAVAQTVWEGDAEHLYDWDTQKARQRPYLPKVRQDADALVPFAYPPYTAAAYAPLATLPYKTAYVLHVLLALAAVWGAARIGGRAGGWVRDNPRPAMVGALALLPFVRGIYGGQNTAFALLFLSTVAGGLASGSPVLAGLGLGLLAFKPQFAVVVGLGLLVARQWTTLVVAAGVAVGWYALAASIAGVDWPVAFLDNLGSFERANAAVDLGQSVTLQQVLRDLAPGVAGVEALRGLVSVAGLVGVGVVAHKRKDDPAAVVAAGAAGLFLVVPHLGFYDVGLLLIPLAAVLDRVGARALPVIAALVIGLSAAGFPTPPATVPMMLLCVGTAIGCLVVLGRRAT